MTWSCVHPSTMNHGCNCKILSWSIPSYPLISAKIRDEMSKFSKSPGRSRPNPRIYSHWKSLGKSRWFQQIHDNKTIFGSKKKTLFETLQKCGCSSDSSDSSGLRYPHLMNPRPQHRRDQSPSDAPGGASQLLWAASLKEHGGIPMKILDGMLIHSMDIVVHLHQDSHIYIYTYCIHESGIKNSHRRGTF